MSAPKYKKDGVLKFGRSARTIVGEPYAHAGSWLYAVEAEESGETFIASEEYITGLYEPVDRGPGWYLYQGSEHSSVYYDLSSNPAKGIVAYWDHDPGENFRPANVTFED